MRLISPQKENLLPAITLCLCLLNLYKHGLDLGSSSFFVSTIGILAVALYALKVSYNKIVFYLWALLQLLIIRQQIPQAAGGLMLTTDILDLSQGFRLAVFAPFKTGSVQYGIGLNFIALFLLILYWVIPKADLKDVEFTFTPYRHDNSLGILFPLRGKAIKYVSLSGEDNWLLIYLNRPFRYQNMDIAHVLIKRNDKQALVPGKNNQLVFFKMVPDLKMIAECDNDKSNFPYEVWALCK